MWTSQYCPNCRQLSCYCTLEEKQRALEILRNREIEERCKRGRRTIIEEEKERIGERIKKMMNGF